MKHPSVGSFSYLYDVFLAQDATDSSDLQRVPAFGNAFLNCICTPADTVDLVSLQGRHEELLPVMN